MDDNEVFMIEARRCLRCGRLLTSQAAVEAGMGCRCMELSKAEEEAMKPIPGQMSLMDYFGKEDVEVE